jgi:type II secretory pathway pseudopilin PulG
VELMVVVLIIGILVAIAVPIFNAAKANAQQKTCWANERTLEGAFQSWNAAGNTYGGAATYAGLTAVLVPDFVKAVPVCPAAGSYTTSFTAGNASVSISCNVAGTAPHGTHP